MHETLQDRHWTEIRQNTAVVGHRQWLGYVAAAVAIAAAGAMVVGSASLGYDAAWSLVWGRDLAAGALPTFDAPVAPTPHPLSNAVAAFLQAVLPTDGALSALAALSWLAYGGLGVACFALGRSLGGWPCGLVAAVLVLSRPLIVDETLITSLDVPFLALCVGATTLAVTRGSASAAPFALLIPAGLLRPEAWLLSVVWAVVAGRHATRSRRVRLAAVGVAAPLIWSLADLVVTGDPLHSFVGTRELADALGRPQSFGRATTVAGAAVSDILTGPLFAAAIGGLLLTLRLPDRAARVTAGLVGLGTLAFLGYGLAGLPVLVRYLLLPAVGLAVLAAWGLTLPQHRSDLPLRPVTGIASALLVALLVLALPGEIRRIDASATALEQRALAFDALRDLVRSPGLQADLRGCRTLVVPNHRAVPLVALWADRTPPGELVAQRDGVPERGLAIQPTTAVVRQLTILDPRDLTQTPTRPPAGWAFRGGNTGWSWFRRC